MTAPTPDQVAFKRREEPHHAAARQPTEDEQAALDHLRAQTLRMRRVGAPEARPEGLVTKPRNHIPRTAQETS